VKLKKWLELSICQAVFLALGSGVVGAAPAAPAYLDSQGGVLTEQRIVQESQGKRAVFFGEFHDNRILHNAELSLLKKLYAVHGSRLVLSLEMLEADEQAAVDAYLAGKLTEGQYLQQARQWPNYKTDYRPLVEFAKEKKLKVLAANVPRNLASILAKTGSLEAVKEKDRPWLPRTTTAPEGTYKEKFYATMAANGSAMPVPPAMRERFFRAQCLKDDKMAETISDYLTKNPKAVVYHVNGCFHSDSRLGTVERLQARLPEAKLLVLSPFKGTVEDWQQQGRPVHGDIVVCTGEALKK